MPPRQRQRQTKPENKSTVAGGEQRSRHGTLPARKKRKDRRSHSYDLRDGGCRQMYPCYLLGLRGLLRRRRTVGRGVTGRVDALRKSWALGHHRTGISFWMERAVCSQSVKLTDLTERERTHSVRSLCRRRKMTLKP